ncbi:MAG: 50S ribosomal protein L4 [Candidatus Peregrinibacteria bacterium]|nr:50S ribosomal protein L4 [Candidatus Peregrinibacteria bacterium]
MAVKAQVYNQEGEKKGDVTLNKDIFEIEINEGLMHRALVLQLANARNPIAHTKTRGEVRGGGRKPHRQKGTGRARVGSIRVPHYRGGGVVFGPRNTRNFNVSMPKKQRRKALFSALSSKAKDNQILVLEKYEGNVKSKDFAAMLKKLPIDRDVLVVMAAKDETIQKSAQNLPNAKTILANYLNIRDLLKYQDVMFLKDALEKVEETFLEKTVATKKAEPKKEKAETKEEINSES